MLTAGETLAQDLEPRRWSHLPTGLNIIGAGVVTTDGDIYFDPETQIEDGTLRLYSLGSSYVRSFEWLGKSSRLDVRLPYVYGRWEGLVEGEYAAIRRHGFGDPRLRLSMLLYGAPPLGGKEYMQYRARHPVATTIGAAVTVVLPWGEYFPDRLINLGGNRYVIRSSLGLLHRRGPWEFEVTTSLSFYQDNDAYYPGASVLERDPLWFLQGHVTRELPRGHWLTLSGGYSYDGESFLNSQSLDYTERTSFLSLGWGMALTRRQSIRVAWVRADTQVALPAARPTRSAAEMERSAPIAARALRETRDRPGGRPTRPCAGHRSWDKTHVACS
jgi:hypothetical protein